MYDTEQSDGCLILRQRSAPWLRAVATVVGAVVVYVCAGIFLVTDLQDVPGSIPARLVGLFVGMIAIIGAASFLWAAFSPDRILTFDGPRRSFVVVEKRPLRRPRIVTRSLDAIASVDVVSEFGDEDDTFHVHLGIHGEDRPVVVRQYLDRSEADALAVRLRALQGG